MHLTLILQTMVAVGLYLFFTAPFLPLILLVHRLGGAYTGWFIAALALQLIPIGLVFLPLGFLGVALLLATAIVTRRRLNSFQRSGLENPVVERQWRWEYLLNLIALGLSLEQKGAAFVFLDANSGGGLIRAVTHFLPASLVLWALLAYPLARAWPHSKAETALPLR